MQALSVATQHSQAIRHGRAILTCVLHIAIILALSGCDNQNKFRVKYRFICTNVLNNGSGGCASWRQEGAFDLNTRNDDDDDSGCFPGETVVIGRYGPIQMSALRIGDEVLGLDTYTGEPVYTAVRTWLHRDPRAEARMLELHTDAGHMLTASPGHLIALHGSDAQDGQSGKKLSFNAARKFRSGDTLVASNGSGMLLTSVADVRRRGLYAPLTYTSNLFVGSSNLSTSSADVEGRGRAVLAHSFAHVRYPQQLEVVWHSLLSLMERFYPSMTRVADDDSTARGARGYVHPLARLCLRVLGITPVESFVFDEEFTQESQRRRLGSGSGNHNNNEKNGDEKHRIITMSASIFRIPPFMANPSAPLGNISLNGTLSGGNFTGGGDRGLWKDDEDEGIKWYTVVFVILAILCCVAGGAGYRYFKEKLRDCFQACMERLTTKPMESSWSLQEGAAGPPTSHITGEVIGHQVPPPGNNVVMGTVVNSAPGAVQGVPVVDGKSSQH